MSHTAAAAAPERPLFPCQAVPEDPRQARLLGLYDQRQEGLLMQRLKIPAGRLTLVQWRRLAEMALQFTPEYPLRLTTRQDVEFHGLRPSDVPALHQALADAGLNTVGACGDTTRAVTADPEGGYHPGSFDMGPLASVLHDHAQAYPNGFGLPRKFKVSLSGDGRAAARPFLQDVGFVANANGSLQVVVAGSLGARPNTGVVAYERIAASEAPALITAALRLFEAEGDRERRTRARLRHVRERLGDKGFLSLLDALFAEEKTRSHPPVPPMVRRDGPAGPQVRLTLAHGRLAPADAVALVEIAASAGAVVRIGLDHDLYFFGLTADALPERFRSWTRAPRVIDCPGARLCQRGVVETEAAAEALARGLDGSGLLGAVAGCPNNCSHAAVADVGLVGRLQTVEGHKRSVFRMLAGGGRGETPALARELGASTPLEAIEPAAKWLVEQWRSAAESTGPGESFTDYVAREGDRLVQGMDQWSSRPA